MRDQSKQRYVSSATLYKLLFTVLAIILLILPFATTFNELLTRIVEQTRFYRIIQAFFVPYIATLLFRLLSALPGLHVASIPGGVVVNGTDVIVSWNCLGWQSFLLFLGSLLVGLRGNFTKSSLLLTVLFGLAGTFLINILRLAFTAALVGWWRELFVILFHNYFASFLTVLWLFFFWWFSYQYLLEEKAPDKSI